MKVQLVDTRCGKWIRDIETKVVAYQAAVISMLDSATDLRSFRDSGWFIRESVEAVAGGGLRMSTSALVEAAREPGLFVRYDEFWLLDRITNDWKLEPGELLGLMAAEEPSLAPDLEQRMAASGAVFGMGDGDLARSVEIAV